MNRRRSLHGRAGYAHRASWKGRQANAPLPEKPRVPKDTQANLQRQAQTATNAAKACRTSETRQNGADTNRAITEDSLVAKRRPSNLLPMKVNAIVSDPNTDGGGEDCGTIADTPAPGQVMRRSNFVIIRPQLRIRADFGTTSQPV